MDISKVLDLVPILSSPSISDRVEWLISTLELLEELDDKYKNKFRIINMKLQSKIL